MQKKPHTPVMLQEVISFLSIQKGEFYIDCTFGSGGHSSAIIENGGNVVAVDRDARNAIFAEEIMLKYPNRLQFFNRKFSQIDDLIQQFKPQGILYDFGVSSMQLDNQDRGFSFLKENRLDMRMGLNKQDAYAVVNKFSEQDLADLIYYYADEKESRKIARKIVETRKIKPIETTIELAQLIENLFPKNFQAKYKIHPATRTFQAIRVAVNDEFDEIKDSLISAIENANNCNICCLSFHSTEDRIVKNVFSDEKFNTLGKKIINITKKPIIPNEVEITANPRSRSAKLRVYKVCD